MWEAIQTGDWSGLVESIVNPMVESILSGIGSMGPFGGFLSGFLGAAISDLLGGGGFFGGGKTDPSESTYKVAVQNWPEQLEAGIDLFPEFLLRQSSNITIQGGQADAKNLARALKTELALT